MHLNVTAGVPAFTTSHGDVWSVELHRWKDPPITSVVWQEHRKTNQADHAPLLPIISLIYSHLCLQFLPALSFYHLASSLIVIVVF